jgi:integrase
VHDPADGEPVPEDGAGALELFDGGAAVEGEIVNESEFRRQRAAHAKAAVDWALSRRAVHREALFDPDEVVSAETDAMAEEGIPETTRDAYRRQWKRFVTWCADTGREHLPATPGTVREYINAHWGWTTVLADGSTKLRGRYGRPYAPATVALALATISVIHQWRGFASPTRHPSVHVQYRGYERRWRKRGWRPDVAHPITPEENIAMVRACDMSTVAGIRDAAMFRLQYELAARASEVCNLEDHDLRWETPERLIVHIDTSKGDKSRDCAVEADEDFAPDVDTLLLLRQWIECKHRFRIPRGKLFTQVNGAGGAPRKDGKPKKLGVLSGSVTAKPVNRHSYEMQFARVAQKAKVHVDPVTGERRHITPHGARSGFITAAVDAGMEIAAVAPHSGHSLNSPVIHRYYRQGRKWGRFNPGRRIREARRRVAA